MMVRLSEKPICFPDPNAFDLASREMQERALTMFRAFIEDRDQNNEEE